MVWNKYISKVKHVQTGNDNFLTQRFCLQTDDDLRVRPLNFNGLLSAVKRIRKNVTDTAETKDYNFATLSENWIVKREKLAPLIYQKLTRANSLTARKSQLKWLQDFNYSDEEGTFNCELAYLMAQSTVHKKHKTDRVPIYTIT